MPLKLNDLLRECGLDPKNVRLVRHAQQKDVVNSPYDLWSNDHSQFDEYQRYHSLRRQKPLTAPYWAVFISTPSTESLFVGLYRVKCLGVSKSQTPMPQIGPGAMAPAGERVEFELKLDDLLRDQIGIMSIEWGEGFRQMVQYADRTEKIISYMASRTNRKKKR